MLRPVQLSPQAVMARLMASVPQVDANAPLGLPVAPAQNAAELNPIEPVIPMAVDDHEARGAHELVLGNADEDDIAAEDADDDEEPEILAAAAAATAAALAENENQDALAEADDSELLTDENVEAEADAIIAHEAMFAAAGTAENVHQRRNGARIARMPQYLRDYEYRRNPRR